MSSNQKYGLLIDYDFCTGCHSCEVACKKEHGLPVGQWGIKLAEDGPRKMLNGKWDWTYVPIPTQLCDLCAARVEMGKLPTCVHHCQAGVMEYGAVTELALKINGKRMVLFAPA